MFNWNSVYGAWLNLGFDREVALKMADEWEKELHEVNEKNRARLDSASTPAKETKP
jgi:hypothetical protein